MCTTTLSFEEVSANIKGCGKTNKNIDYTRHGNDNLIVQKNGIIAKRRPGAILASIPTEIRSIFPLVRRQNLYSANKKSACISKIDKHCVINIAKAVYNFSINLSCA